MSDFLFDTIIVISLERKKQRRKRIKKRIESLNIEKICDVIFLDAVDGTLIDEDWITSNGYSILPNYYDWNFKRGITFGEVGCSLSHHKAWTEVLSNDNINNALIIEDDALFLPNFFSKIISIKNEIKNLEWEFIYLSRKTFLNTEKEIEISESLVKPNFSYWCLAYVINKSGAKKLIEGQLLNNIIPADEYVPIMLDTPNWGMMHLVDNFKNFPKLISLATKENIINPESHAFDNSETEKTKVYFKNNFYEDGVDKFCVITVATENNDALDRFKKSCAYYNIPYKILGLGQEWSGGRAENGVLLEPGGGQKVNLLKEELINWPNPQDHIIMFTDSYDVVFNSSPFEIIEKFRKFRSNIVFSAEKDCWPNRELESQYPDSPTDYKFLNSGGFIGYADRILEVLKSRDIDNSYDDQLFYTEMFFNKLNTDDKIILDYYQEIFQTLNMSTEDVEVLKQSQMKNKVTQSIPCVVHANGPSSVKRFLDEKSNFMFGQYMLNYGSKHKNDEVTIEDNKIINIGLFFNHELNDINQAFDHIRFLNYDKNKINLFVYSNNSGDLYSIQKFKKNYGSEYLKFEFIIHDKSLTNIRKQFLIDSYDKCDFALMIDSNYIFRNINSLRNLINEDKGVVSPMIQEQGSTWVNFDMDDNETKNKIQNYSLQGNWNVSFITGIIMFRNDYIPYGVNSLYVGDDNYEDYDWDIRMSNNLISKNIYLNLTNSNYYGGIIG